MVLIRSLFLLLWLASPLRAQIVIVRDASTPEPLLLGITERFADEALATERTISTRTVKTEDEAGDLWRLQTWQAVLWLAKDPIHPAWRHTWEIEGVRLFELPAEDFASAAYARAAGARLADEALVQQCAPDRN